MTYERWNGKCSVNLNKSYARKTLQESSNIVYNVFRNHQRDVQIFSSRTFHTQLCSQVSK